MKFEIHLTISDDDLATGWDGDGGEAALSIRARLCELIGDDGGSYAPSVHGVKFTA